MTITAVDDNGLQRGPPGDGERYRSGPSNDVRVTDPDDVTLTITEDDDKPVTASFEQDSYTVSEGSGVTVKVTLSEDPEREVVIPLDNTELGGATPSDYSVPASVSFQSGDTGKSITFTATDDNLDDDGESVELTFGTLPSGVSGGATTTTTVTITDDDMEAGKVTLTLTPSTIDESGSDNVSTVTASLGSTSTAATTVTVSTALQHRQPGSP